MQRITFWTRPSEWILSRFTHRTALGTGASLTVILAILFTIGLVDYALGIHVSLVVFYLVPVLLATAWLTRAAAVGIALLSGIVRIAGDIASIGAESLPLYTWWNAFTTLLVFLFVIWIFGNLLGLYRSLETRIAERTSELLASVEHRRLLEHELLGVSSRERNAMGQELHDDICQHLVATALAGKVLAQRLSQIGNPLVAEAQAIVALVEEGAGKTRRLARGLLLSEIDPDVLVDKLRELADEGAQSGVQCRFSHAGHVVVADASIAAQLYRIAQEAMRNAIKHADARKLDISLVGDADAICLMVEDDGTGLPDAEPSSGMGLPIMLHRAAFIGATLSLIPSSGRGTRVICHLPVGLAA
jgi:signal transduction histidine kinase